jgi:hypothetical protein
MMTKWKIKKPNSGSWLSKWMDEHIQFHFFLSISYHSTQRMVWWTHLKSSYVTFCCFTTASHIVLVG